MVQLRTNLRTRLVSLFQKSSPVAMTALASLGSVKSNTNEQQFLFDRGFCSQRIRRISRLGSRTRWFCCRKRSITSSGASILTLFSLIPSTITPKVGSATFAAEPIVPTHSLQWTFMSSASRGVAVVIRQSPLGSILAAPALQSLSATTLDEYSALFTLSSMSASLARVSACDNLTA